MGQSILNDLMNCANAHAPDACLVGNVTARDVRQFCIELSILRGDVEKLESLIDGLGTDPNPDDETPEAAIKRHHAKAWEWARIANDAAREASQKSELLKRALDLLAYPLVHRSTPDSWVGDARALLRDAESGARIAHEIGCT